MLSPISSRSGPWDRGWSLGRFDHAGSRQAGTIATRSMDMLRALTRTRETDVALQITTDDGDTVTLTLHSELERTSIDYRSSTRGPGGIERTRLDYRESSSSQDLTVEVQGSLDADEVSDVNALIQRVRAIMGDLLGGGAGKAVAELATLDGGSEEFDSLAGFRLDVSRTDTVEMVIARLRQWSRPSPVGAPRADAPVDRGDDDASLPETDAPPVAIAASTTDAVTDPYAWLMDASRRYVPPAAVAID